MKQPVDGLRDNGMTMTLDLTIDVPRLTFRFFSKCYSLDTKSLSLGPFNKKDAK